MAQTCETCGKEFSRKGGLEKHRANKRPCKRHLQIIQQALQEAGVPVPEAEGAFRESSKTFNKKFSKEIRADQGIYFTPKKARDLLFDTLEKFGVNPKRILEPSFGSGEFLLDARRLYPAAAIVGVEKNEELFKSVTCAGAELVCGDFLSWTGKADLIIGNPPYFLMKTDDMTPTEKKAFAAKNAVCMTGRPNIYISFLYKCVEEHLEEGGFLAFIVPTSLYNAAYYQPMRNYISGRCRIRWLETLDRPGFFETGQETTLIVLEKVAPAGSTDYLFVPKTGTVYITPFYKELAALTAGSTTLGELGLGVKTGNVVWNQVKEKLGTTGTLLIYSSNINGSELKLNNLLGTEKKQYVAGLDKPKLDGPVILVERGYGNSFRFNAVLVQEKGFYAENHLNVIYPTRPEGAANLERVMASLKDERSIQFVRWFLGNGSMTATDLETLVPIV
jgi:adenine-specific DNA-methyltransferase